MDFLLATFLGKLGRMWLGFLALVALLIAFDLGVLHRKTREIGVGESLRLSAFYILAGLGFGGLVWWQLGPRSGLEYFTGFVVEKSLAMDNIFAIALIFGFFAIPRHLQHRVLFWSILGVILLRGVMIGLGAALVDRYPWWMVARVDATSLRCGVLAVPGWRDHRKARRRCLPLQASPRRPTCTRWLVGCQDDRAQELVPPGAVVGGSAISSRGRPWMTSGAHS